MGKECVQIKRTRRQLRVRASVQDDELQWGGMREDGMDMQ